MGLRDTKATIPGTASGKRKLTNWIDSWLEYTEVFPSPEIFRRWAGIATIGACLERKVWAHTRGSNIYPNLYAILVGPPGVGKSAVLSPVERLMRGLEPNLFVAPSSVTTASVIDSLAAADRKIIRPNSTPNFVHFHSLQVIASELGVFLPTYDPAFMNTLTKLYDGEIYEERRRSAKVLHTKIESPLLSILGGTTPSYLNSFLPEGAWDQGFTSRSIFIYSGEQPKPGLFDESDSAEHDRLEALYKSLVFDLKSVNELFGKVAWTSEAMTSISAWDKAGCPPVPEHPKLTHYNSRRTAHVIKLAIISSISQSNGLVIDLTDFQTALEWILEAEAAVPEIFKNYGVSQDARIIEDCYYFVFQSYAKDKKPIREHRIIAFLASRAPSYQVGKIVEIMVRSGALKQDLSTGSLAFVPGERRPGQM